LEKGNYERSLAAYNKALSLRLAAMGKLNPSVAQVYNFIAGVHLKRMIMIAPSGFINRP
jgi:hypothetical protein